MRLLLLLALIPLFFVFLSCQAGWGHFAAAWGVLFGAAALQILLLRKCRRSWKIWIPGIAAVLALFGGGIAAEVMLVQHSWDLILAMLFAVYVLYFLVGLILGAVIETVKRWRIARKSGRQ